MKISKHNVIITTVVAVVFVVALLVLVARGVDINGFGSNRAKFLPSSAINEKVTSFAYKSPITRERIRVNEKFKVQEGQIINSDMMYTPHEVKEITITSVKHVYLQDRGNGHTLFQGCFIVTGGYTCTLFVLNNSDVLVQLTPSSQYDFHDGKDYHYELQERVLRDEATASSKSFFVRVNEAPYVYQEVECSDATTASSCSLVGYDPDTVDEKTGIAKKVLALYKSASTFGLETTSLAYREQKIYRSSFATTTTLIVHEEEVNQHSKRVSISLLKNNDNSTQIFKGEVDTSTNVTLEYDYSHLADVAYIRIGPKRFTFTFSTGIFVEVK